jgi:DNA/RNA-binding domain of Phe-tRNA-synthetase-like protein
MVKISILEELKSRCPGLRLGCIDAEVTVAGSSAVFLHQIDESIERIAQNLIIENISKIPPIADSRKAYKSCGKDPARYRLSAEALLRRVVSGKGLYQINNVVDQLNLVSVSTGFSIGGYDADQIQGNVTFGIGRRDEPYSGIGRGELNIEGLPVFRDDAGPFGTPTSDSQRTEVTANTRQFLMVLVDFGGDGQLDDAVKMSVGLLQDFCQARNIEIKFIV